MPLKPIVQSGFGLTAVLSGAQFVPRNFDAIYVLIFQYVGIGSHGLRPVVGYARRGLAF